MDQTTAHCPCSCSECGEEQPFMAFSGILESGEGLIAIRLEDSEDPSTVAVHVFDLEEARSMLSSIIDAINTTEQRVRDFKPSLFAQ
jgi:hypothetical protein